MQSNNPVFRRSEAFNGKANVYGNQTAPGSGPYAGYGDPSTWGTGTPGTPGSTTYAGPTRRMTIDSVVQSTAIAFTVVLVGAIATWLNFVQFLTIRRYLALVFVSLVGLLLALAVAP